MNTLLSASAPKRKKEKKKRKRQKKEKKKKRKRKEKRGKERKREGGEGKERKGKERKRKTRGRTNFSPRSDCTKSFWMPSKYLVPRLKCVLPTCQHESWACWLRPLRQLMHPTPEDPTDPPPWPCDAYQCTKIRRKKKNKWFIRDTHARTFPHPNNLTYMG